jgi:hypothetical protein
MHLERASKFFDGFQVSGVCFVLSISHCPICDTSSCSQFLLRPALLYPKHPYSRAKRFKVHACSEHPSFRARILEKAVSHQETRFRFSNRRNLFICQEEFIICRCRR